MKIVLLLMAVLLCNVAVFSQWANNEDPLRIKELKLTRLQQKEIRKINYDAKSAIDFLNKEDGKSEENTTRINKVEGVRVKNITKCLSKEQQIIWREKLRENKPRRGVTGLPNERTVP